MQYNKFFQIRPSKFGGSFNYKRTVCHAESCVKLVKSQKDVDSQDTLCYDVREVKNLKESEVIMMLTVKFEIAIEYSMKTSACAY